MGSSLAFKAHPTPPVTTKRSSSEAKAEPGGYYEVRVGRVGQADHTSVPFVWQVRSSYSPRQETGCDESSRYLNRPYQPQSFRMKAEFLVKELPRLVLDAVWPRARREGRRAGRHLTRFVAGARVLEAMMRCGDGKVEGHEGLAGLLPTHGATDVCPTCSDPRT